MLRWVAGGVTAARGFVAGGMSAGIKRSRKPDLSLVVSDGPAVCVGTLTTNRVQAAPVLVSRSRLAAGRARAVMLNSGCANCLTGAPGVRDALAMGRAAARALRVPERQVLIASTGMIGRRLPIAKIVRAVPWLATQLSREGHAHAAAGILTTDTVTKEVAVQASIDGVVCTVGGMAKGAGMIMPGMATMLCVITTDAAIDRPLLVKFVREAVEHSFNRINVDGDMSTNDTVYVLANGRSGVRITPGTAGAARFARMLGAVTQDLAYQIVKDGEGATRVAAIHVKGARSEREALACARQVAASALVQTMLASGDPNVGRIAAAAGASGAWFDQDTLEVRIGGELVVSRGAARAISGAMAKRLFAPREMTIELRLHAGRGAAQVLTCDLTEAYVRLNARYTT